MTLSTLQKRFRTKLNITPYLFLLPALLIYTLFSLGPSIASLFLSFFRWNFMTPTTEFVGFKHYIYILGNERFWHALSNNFIYLILVLIVPVIIGLSLAVLIMEIHTGRTLYRLLNFLPAIFSGVVVAYVWKWIFDPNLGFLNQIFRSIGLGSLALAWLGDSRVVLYATFVPFAWSDFGYVMVIYLAGLQSIDRELLEAAIVDGANFFQRTLKVTIPMLREVTTFVLALGILNGMNVFTTVFILTRGGPYYASDVIGTYIYRSFGDMQFGRATAAATINAIIVVTATFIFLRLREREST